MPLLPYDYLHLVNCPEVVIISDILCTENPGYSDIPLTVTLFCRPNTVTVSGEACSSLYFCKLSSRKCHPIVHVLLWQTNRAFPRSGGCESKIVSSSFRTMTTLLVSNLPLCDVHSGLLDRPFY